MGDQGSDPEMGGGEGKKKRERELGYTTLFSCQTVIEPEAVQGRMKNGQGNTMHKKRLSVLRRFKKVRMMGGRRELVSLALGTVVQSFTLAYSYCEALTPKVGDKHAGL